MSLFKKIFGTDKSRKDDQKESLSRVESAVSLQEDNSSLLKDNNEIVAAIMAAIMNMLSSDAVSDLKIKTIRRINRNSPQWNIAGRDEYIASKL